jgi:glycerophosphoryl diester phosphodiesterase
VEAGVDTIELDVLWTRDGHPRIPTSERAPLVVAHDWHDAARREPLTLAETLDAFLEPPLERIEVDLDIKLPGREEEIVAALRERDLLRRAMVSTMELSTLARVGELEPRLRRGWTYPKVRRDWASKRWAKAPMLAAMLWMRERLPGLATRELPRLGVEAMWVYHPIVSRRLARVTDLAGVELIAWTVDDLPLMRKLVAAGVDGICSNDPRLFARLSP